MEPRGGDERLCKIARDKDETEKDSLINTK